jgi:stearoyl-CoA desaturase (Delta-9 desaturase)
MTRVGVSGTPTLAGQHRLYPLIGIIVGLLAPAAVGHALGDGWGGLVLAGLARLVFVYHVTFSINSFAHMLGTQPYSDRSTARDSFIAAMLSMGEGYHNFHHTFPADYRNGVHAHQFDPSKWLIRFFAWCGLARNLKRTSAAIILRARVRMEARRLEAQAACPSKRDRLVQMKASFEEHLAQWHALITRHEEARIEKKREILARLQPELRRLRRHVRSLQRDWDDLARSIELGTTATG